MKNKLFWRLCTFIGLGTVLLFWAIDWLTNHTETSMSFIDQHYQQQLFDYGKKAEDILINEGEEALAKYIETLQATEHLPLDGEEAGSSNRTNLGSGCPLRYYSICWHHYAAGFY